MLRALSKGQCSNCLLLNLIRATSSQREQSGSKAHACLMLRNKTVLSRSQVAKNE
jgi:hypothetical protein